MKINRVTNLRAESPVGDLNETGSGVLESLKNVLARDVVEAVYFAGRVVKHRKRIGDLWDAGPYKGIPSEPTMEQARLGCRILGELLAQEGASLKELSEAGAGRIQSELYALAEPGPRRAGRRRPPSENPRRRCACGSALTAAWGPFEHGRSPCVMKSLLGFSSRGPGSGGNVSAPGGPHACPEPVEGPPPKRERRPGFSKCDLASAQLDKPAGAGII
jgi:hypothetical protein